MGANCICTADRTQIAEQQRTLQIRRECGLKHLIECSDRHKNQAPPNALRGLEGMLFADRFLKERDVIGLLIGSLALESYNSTATEENLSSYKDVDVLVINHLPLKQDFEGGIDWWIPDTGKDTAIRNFKNGNEVVLRYSVLRDTRHPPKKPGLYITSRKMILDMKEYEAIPLEEHEDKLFDTSVMLDYIDFLKNKIGKVVAAPIVDKFSQQILSEPYTRKIYLSDTFGLMIKPNKDRSEFSYD